jgi:peptidoglycan-associated lipoprotein
VEEPEVRVAEQPVAPLSAAKPTPPPAEPLAELSEVYFDFDQYAIRVDTRSALGRNGNLLKSQPNQKIVIEGHCDERGTSAYNLVLGERRAQAAKRYLQDLGLALSQIEITSYGKERPFCTEHSEACWQSNRRVHFRQR